MIKGLFFNGDDQFWHDCLLYVVTK